MVAPRPHRSAVGAPGSWAHGPILKMNLFNRLPGFQRSPAGLEWALLRRLPQFAVAGTVVPLLCVLMVRLAAGWESGIVSAKLAMSIEIALASLVIL